MSAPLIQSLIDKTDSFERVRDQIAAILLLESSAQVVMAAASGKDSTLWNLRVFTERANPWDVFQDPPTGDADDPDFDPSPLVNVSFASETFDKSMGDVFERQQGVALYNIDCYGFAISQEDGDGHKPADNAAALVAQRAARLVRNILSAAKYTYLGLQTKNQGPVSGRWFQSLTAFVPSTNERSIQHVEAVRLVLEVGVVELSPQVVGQTLQAVGIAITRQANGQVLLTADVPPA